MNCVTQPARNSERIDFAAVRREHMLVSVAAASLKLERAGQEWKACCPFHADQSPSFTIFKDGSRFHCFGCGAGGDVIDFLKRLHGVGVRDAVRMLCGGSIPSTEFAPPRVPDMPAVGRLDEARAIWRAASPIAGTLAEKYLRCRGIHMPLPATLRFATLRYGRRGSEYPVMVAAISGLDRDLIGIQRTYIDPNGLSKASVPKAKLSLGRVSGGSIKLAPTARELIVTEGIEDALTLQQELGRAVWAAAGGTMMPAMRFPSWVASVAIGGDNDDPGREAARKASAAFSSRGLQSRAFFPDAGKDFNAELMGRAGA